MLIKNGHNTCVYGREPYAESTLKSMKKEELIELLCIAQHNYEALLENYGNVQSYAEKLQKEATNQSSGWIPVEERLPENEVLCCDECGHMLVGYIFKDEYSNTGYNAESDNESITNVVAWQPLPQPYKKE